MLDARFAFFGCNHAPITNKEYWSWLLGQLEDYQPAYLIHGGDWFEGLAASRWGKRPEQKWHVLDEFEAVVRQANDLNRILPNAKKVWIYGNHDSNLFDEPFRVHEDLRPLLDWQTRNTGGLRDALDGWNVVDVYSHRSRFRLGPVTFQHGGNTGTALTEGHLKDQAYSYSTPFGLHLSVHTHAPVQITQARERKAYLPYWYGNAGCGVDFDQMFYMNRNSMEAWGRGLILGTVPVGSINQRRTAYATKQWQAELLVHSYASKNRFAA